MEEASYLMNLAIKELADTKFEVLLSCCLSILNLFPLTSTNIFLCAINSLPNEYRKKNPYFHLLQDTNLAKKDQKVGVFREISGGKKVLPNLS